MRRPVVILAAVGAAVGLALAACSSSSTDSADEASDSADRIVISDVWVREVPKTAERTAAYMVIENDGDTDDELLDASASAELAQSVQVHETVTEEGGSGAAGDSGAAMTGMQEVTGIEIAAGESVQLEPGGYHIMIMGLEKPITAGETIPITLEFSESGEMKVDAEVRAA